MLFGALLGLLNAHKRPATSLLEPAPGTVSETERFFDRMNRDSAFNGAISRVVNAVEATAAAGPARVCAEQEATAAATRRRGPLSSDRRPTTITSG